MISKRDDKRSIILTLDSAHKVKIEPYREFETSLFRGVYENAAFMVADIIGTARRDAENRRDTVVTNSEPICNIISYLGERGEGKTSAMLSFCNFLAQIDTIEKVRAKSDKKQSVLNTLIDDMQNNNACFQVLDCIDVTLLHKDETIVDIILGKMLDKIRQCEKHLVGDIQISISRIYDSLHRQNVYDDAALAVLSGRSKSWKLREDFQDLFHQFNKLFAGKHDCRSCYTVLMIDDIDMNVEHCYEMLEMIRQYLMLPNVVIMMSINYGQLETVCQNYYFGKLFLGKPADEQLLQSAARSSADMTKAYLEKILPDGRRLYMPDLYREDGAFEKRVGITSVNRNTGAVHHFDIKQVILFNLHRYVRIPFDGSNGEVHYLQPDTLRQLNDYIMQFNHLMILDGSVEDDIKAYEYNSRWFYDDLLNRYIAKQLGIESIKRVKEFLDTNLNDKLQFLYRYLRKQLTANAYGLKDGGKLNPKEIGYGEIIQLIRIIEQNDLLDWKEIQSMKSVLSLIMTRMVFMINKWREVIYRKEKGDEEVSLNAKPEEELDEWRRSFEVFTRASVWSRVIENTEFTGNKRVTGIAEQAAEAKETDKAEQAAEAKETNKAEQAAEAKETDKAEQAAEAEETDKAEQAAEAEETDKAEQAAEAEETDKAEKAGESGRTPEQANNVADRTELSKELGFEFDRKNITSFKKAILCSELASLFVNCSEAEIKENAQVSEVQNDLFDRKPSGLIRLVDNKSCRFGSCIYNIWNYREWLRAIEADITKKAELTESTETDELFVLYKEMEEWEQKHKTTAAIPFYSVEVMNMIADKLKQDLGDKYGNAFYIEPKNIEAALNSIQDTLKEIDKFFEMEELILEGSEKKALGAGYAVIFRECPVVKHIREKDIYESLFAYLDVVLATELSGRVLGGDYDMETKD